jgi:hypothetical protein
MTRLPDKTIGELVIQAGGIFVGIQEDLVHGHDLVLFNDPATQSTLALPISKICIAAIRDKIKASRSKFDKDILNGR